MSEDMIRVGDVAVAPPVQLPPELLPSERFVGGFDGMATAAFGTKVASVFGAPVNQDDVEIRPDGIVYLPGVFYRDMLIRAFGPGGWAIAPRGPIRTRAYLGGELVVYHGSLWCMGRFVAEAVGQCIYYPKNRGMTFADAAEGARTDCIGRCCKDLGVRDLWDPSWREQWKAKYAKQDSEGKWERKSRPSKMTTTAPQSASAPSASSMPHASSGASAASNAAAATGATTPESTPTETTVAAEALLTELTREPGKVIPFPSPPPSDTGEAPSKSSLDELRDLLKTLGWKRQWTQEWFNARFGMAPTALTDIQLRTAYRLLYAWGETGADGELYKGTLAAEVAAGRCKADVTE